MAGSAKDIRAGKAYVEVSGDSSKLVSDLRADEKRLKAFGKSVSAIGAAISGAGAALTTPFFGAAKSFSDVGTELKDVSDRTGLTIENLSALSYAAAQTETDIGTLENGLRKMARTLVKGSEENFQAEATFAALGLSVDKLMRMSPDQQFERIAKAIGAIPNPTAKAAAAMEIFGKSGTQLLPLIADMDTLVATAEDLGLVMSAEDAAAAHALGDAMTDITAVLGRTAQIVGATLAPVLIDTAKAITQVAKTAFDWVDANRALLASVFEAGVAIAGVGAAVTAAGIAIYGLGAAFGVVATAIGAVFAPIAALISPVGLLVAELVGLSAWFLKTSGIGGQALSWLGQRFGDLRKSAAAALGGIANALKAGDIALAGQVLWAGLKVEWLKGIGALNAIWADWGTATLEVFRGVSYQLAGLMLDAWASIQKGFVSAVGVMQDLWTSFGGFFAKVWEQIKSLFTGDDITSEIERINKEVADAQAARAEGRQSQVAGIDASNASAQQALKDQQQSEIDARRNAAQQGLAGDADALRAAQDELAGLLSQAGKAAADAGSLTASKPPGKMPEFTPESLDAAVQQTRAKVDVAGGFSASALAGLGVGSTVGDQQLSEQKKTNDKLEKLTRTVKTKQAAFT